MTPRAVLITLVIALTLVSTSLLQRRRALSSEIGKVTSAQASTIEATGDARLTAAVDRIRVALERARSTPASTAEPHLALSDGLLTLERGDIVFRSSTVAADVPRGTHLIERVDAAAIVLVGGIVLRPVTSLADTLPPAAGTVRIPRVDFDAIRPNLRPGLTAFFF